MPKKHPQRRSRSGQCLRLSRYCLQALAWAIAFYFSVVLLGLLPVNNAFEPTADGIEIFLISSAVHADIVVPVKTDVLDWRKFFPARAFAGDATAATLAAIGWGDRGFFIATPTWADLQLTTAAKALFWPTAACLHVSLIARDSLPADAKSVKISTAQYEQLTAYIRKSFRVDRAGSPLQIPNAAYGPRDAFFEARGKYSCLNTCNSWVGRAMQAAGLRAGWFTPLPKTMFLYLPD